MKEQGNLYNEGTMFRIFTMKGPSNPYNRKERSNLYSPGGRGNLYTEETWLSVQ